MKRWVVSLAIAVIACALVGPCLLSGQQSRSPKTSPKDTATIKPKWPRTFLGRGAKLVVCQPQIRSWRDFRTIRADTAVSIAPEGGKPVLGVISWRAHTMADVSANAVYVYDIRVVSARFPYLDSTQEAAMQRRVHQFYPKIRLTFELERMIAALEKANIPTNVVDVSVKPPTILVSNSSAILLTVEGKPILAPIQGMQLKYVVNTRWNLFYNGSEYYLLNGRTWLKSRVLSSGRKAARHLPAEMSRLPSGQGWDDVIRAVRTPSEESSAPKVFYTHTPAELIVFKGRPSYRKIRGTDLSYATNTDRNVFLYRKDHQVYILVSGRWFRAPGMQGPWVYAGKDLPADFTRIPLGHPYSMVLASVPGTQEANDAVLLALVPTTAIVNRAAAEAQVKVSYAGEPQFKPIEDTSLYYAVNTSDKVIRVGDLYYLCFEGVWFVSPTPMGPWKTASSVPPAIYAIPPSSPVYNVTYVTVLNPTPTTVVSCYSGGYLGMFVAGGAAGATVVYGTGFYYPPYVSWGPYPVFYPYPYTYGVAAVYNPYVGVYAVGSRVYGPYAAAGATARYNPVPGTYRRAATVQGPYGGRSFVQAYNPWTGTYAATTQGRNQYNQWGNSVLTNGNNWARSRHGTTSRGTAGSFENSGGATGVGFSGTGGNRGFVTRGANNNIYAGGDGQVYKKDSAGGWSKWDNGNWTPVQPPSNQVQNRQPSSTSQGLGAAARQQSAGTLNGKSPRNLEPSSTMQQLRKDSAIRQRGDQLQQFRSRGLGAGGGRFGGGGNIRTRQHRRH